jgi:hypothetical protein
MLIVRSTGMLGSPPISGPFFCTKNSTQLILENLRHSKRQERWYGVSYLPECRVHRTSENKAVREGLKARGFSH